MSLYCNYGRKIVLIWVSWATDLPITNHHIELLQEKVQSYKDLLLLIRNQSSSKYSCTCQEVLHQLMLNISCRMHCVQDPYEWMDIASSSSFQYQKHVSCYFFSIHICLTLPLSSHPMATWIPWFFAYIVLHDALVPILSCFYFYLPNM